MSRLNSTLSQERLHEVLSYNQETGLFTRRQKTAKGQKVGLPVGSVTAKGYRKINVDGMSYPAHHLAWFYVHGVFIDSHIEHIDGNRLNNSIANLRVLVKETHEVTQAYLKEVLSYDENTGIFRWRRDMSTQMKAGDVAGSIITDGYWRIGLNGKAHKAHRLAWLYMYGQWPGVIDHIDGDRLNNKINNLRDTTRSVNCQNLKRASKANKSCGFLGVTQYKPGKYQAQIRVGRRFIYLGSFDSPEEAHAAYLQKKREVHPGCTI